MSAAPKTIPFNLIDRSYLIPETEDNNGTYFPMSLVISLNLKDAVSKSEVVVALVRLAEQYPQLKLAYELDFIKTQWKRLPNDSIQDHLQDCVQTLDNDQPINEVISGLLCENNTPISQAINIFLVGSHLIIRIHHSWGDGKALFTFVQYLLASLQNNFDNILPLGDKYWVDISSIIWKKPSRVFKVLGQFFKSFTRQMDDFQRDMVMQTDNTRQAIVSGSPMNTKFVTLDEKVTVWLNQERKKASVSFNSIIQAMLSEHLENLGFLNTPRIYTVAVDLRRYLDTDGIVPSNLATQIRIRIDDSNGWQAIGKDFDTQVREQLNSYMPLASVPGEWLLSLAGSTTYRSMNRDWLLKSTHNDPRFFTVSNLGDVSAFFQPVEAILATDFQPNIFIPLMGAPPLVIFVSTWANKVSFSITYDPQVLDEEQVQSILQVFNDAAM